MLQKVCRFFRLLVLVAQNTSVRFASFFLVQNCFSEVALEAQNARDQMIAQSLFDNLKFCIYDIFNASLFVTLTVVFSVEFPDLLSQILQNPRTILGEHSFDHFLNLT